MSNGATLRDIVSRGTAHLRRKKKMVLVAVSPRMHAAIKARPEELRLVAEDEDGKIVVIDRPYRRPWNGKIDWDDYDICSLLPTER